MTTNEADTEKKIFEAITNNDINVLKTLLVDQQEINILDENLMTPLQHAAYKGNKEMVQLFLDQGADVNLCQHQHGYTALHFAGLSGNAEVCTLLLLAGAKSHLINTVGRTPSQMSAFVGNHNCVSTINNFIPKSEIDYYATISGQQTKPSLPPFLTESFHKFVMQINVNPVRIALNLQRFAGLTEHLEEVSNVLQLMCTREMKRGSETNEVMAFKYHHLHYVVREMIRLQKNQNKEESEKKSDLVEVLSRKLLKPGKEGNLDYMDGFLRESVRSFPFRECTILRQMVATLAAKDPPSAIGVISSAINGQRGFVDNIPICQTCGEEKPAKKCSKCKVVQYCDRECQRMHWFIHKKACARLSQGEMQSGPVKPDPKEITADMQNLLVN
ncbi:hypothetical protein FQR65_LT08677 [Abscondita terminalis]|nr:hypothetical protein FQR65_LT08677 [Abscondita terminalis]